MKNKWKRMSEIENEVKWFSDVYVTFSLFMFIMVKRVKKNNEVTYLNCGREW